MSRQSRLFNLLDLLRDGEVHRAEDLAQALNVTPRSIYRDIDTLVASGVPVTGKRGQGYRMQQLTPLPPLSLTDEELQALNLAIAIVSESNDPALEAAARSLADKIDANLPLDGPAHSWRTAFTPFASAARGFSHIAVLRNAITRRQKLRLITRRTGGEATSRTVRPLKLSSNGPIWILTAWCELRQGFRDFRMDLIESAAALPELFVDEPGKTLQS